MIKVISDIPQFPPGNPFHHDMYNMGVRLGMNIVVMHSNQTDKECPYLIICNTETGERIRVEFKDDQRARLLGELFDTMIELNLSIRQSIQSKPEEE